MQNNMITRGNWSTFLTLKEEQLLLVKRRHPFVIIMPLVAISCLFLFFLSTTVVIFQGFFVSYPLFITTTLLLISITLSLITKVLVDWYFHMYILTNRKILERRYTPLASYTSNDVLLDKVNCTEIDLRTNGLLNELIDMGDVIITFDRPTHQEEFVLKDIQGSHALATYLTQQLMDGRPTEVMEQPIWFKQHTVLSTT